MLTLGLVLKKRWTIPCSFITLIYFNRLSPNNYIIGCLGITEVDLLCWLVSAQCGTILESTDRTLTSHSMKTLCCTPPKLRSSNEQVKFLMSFWSRSFRRLALGTTTPNRTYTVFHWINCYLQYKKQTNKQSLPCWLLLADFQFRELLIPHKLRLQCKHHFHNPFVVKFTISVAHTLSLTFSILNWSLAWPIGRELFWIRLHMLSLQDSFFCCAMRFWRW